LASLGMEYAPRGREAGVGAPPRGIPDVLDDVSLDDLDPDLGGVGMSVPCDVTNPLLGPRGAAAVYGPQKGATADQVAYLDGHLGTIAGLLEDAIRQPLPVCAMAGA